MSAHNGNGAPVWPQQASSPLGPTRTASKWIWVGAIVAGIVATWIGGSDIGLPWGSSTVAVSSVGDDECVVAETGSPIRLNTRDNELYASDGEQLDVVPMEGQWVDRYTASLECMDSSTRAELDEEMRLETMYKAGLACFHPEGGLIEYEGSEFSHRDPDVGTCLTDLEQMLREGLACRLDDDTIVAYEGSDYVDRDMSRKCLTKDDLADSEELVARLTAFAESQANKAWGDKASALVTEYCSSTDERRTLVTQEQRSAVFDAFDTEYSEGQVYTGLPRDFGRAVSEWCGSESVLHPIAVPPQEVPQEPAPMKTVPPLPEPGDG